MLVSVMSTAPRAKPQNQGHHGRGQGVYRQPHTTLSPDYIGPEYPPTEQETVDQSYENIMGVLKNFKVCQRDIRLERISDLDTRSKFSRQSLLVTDFVDETVGMPFMNEATSVAESAPNENGEFMVKHVKEFLDSRFAIEFMQLANRERDFVISEPVRRWTLFVLAASGPVVKAISSEATKVYCR